MKVRTIQKEIYVAADGQEFENKALCELHEMQLNEEIIKNKKRAMGLAIHLHEFCVRNRTANNCDSLMCPFSLDGKCVYEQPPYTWNFVKKI